MFDIPYDAGCYEILTPLSETPIPTIDIVTPAWCITECLKADTTKRFACKLRTSIMTVVEFHSKLVKLSRQLHPNEPL